MTPPLSERIAVLEIRCDRIAVIEEKVDALDAKLDALMLQLAKRASGPIDVPHGWSLSRTAQQSVGGIIGAVLFYLFSALTSANAEPAVLTKRLPEPAAVSVQSGH